MLLVIGHYFISFANKIHLQSLLFSYKRSAVAKVTLDQFLDRLNRFSSVTVQSDFFQFHIIFVVLFHIFSISASFLGMETELLSLLQPQTLQQHLFSSPISQLYQSQWLSTAQKSSVHLFALSSSCTRFIHFMHISRSCPVAFGSCFPALVP